jgi:hypothetical protein
MYHIVLRKGNNPGIILDGTGQPDGITLVDDGREHHVVVELP